MGFYDDWKSFDDFRNNSDSINTDRMHAYQNELSSQPGYQFENSYGAGMNWGGQTNEQLGRYSYDDMLGLIKSKDSRYNQTRYSPEGDSLDWRNYTLAGVGNVQYDPQTGRIERSSEGRGGPDGNYGYREWKPGQEAQDVYPADGWIDSHIGKYVPALTAAVMTGGVAAGLGAFAGAGAGAAGAGAAEGAGFAAIPSGGMAATGAATPWATSASGLGSGFWGTSAADMGALMGTSGGAFELGTGLSGITAADLAASTGGVDWLSHAQKLAKLLSNGNSAAPSAQGGSGGTVGGTTSPASSNFFSQAQPQAIDLMPKFSTEAQQNSYSPALGNSQNINRLAQALLDNKGNVYG